MGGWTFQDELLSRGRGDVFLHRQQAEAGLVRLQAGGDTVLAPLSFFFALYPKTHPKPQAAALPPSLSLSLSLAA